MRIPFKGSWSKFIVDSKYAIVFIVAASILTACTKTEDYLRDKIIKHSDFVDPGSAIFRNVTYHDSLSFGNIWCGEINAKNRMGGYAGWKPFRVNVYKDGKVDVTVLQPEEAPYGASAERRDIIESLNKSWSKIYTIMCGEDAQPAPSHVPFWKAF